MKMIKTARAITGIKEYIIITSGGRKVVEVAVKIVIFVYK